MMRTRWIAVGALFVLMTPALAQFAPPQGFVPDKTTAIAIARAIFTKYAPQVLSRGAMIVVDQETPDRWIVAAVPNNAAQTGGCVEIEIAKKDGRVIRMWFGQ